MGREAEPGKVPLSPKRGPAWSRMAPFPPLGWGWAFQQTLVPVRGQSQGSSFPTSPEPVWSVPSHVPCLGF